MPVLLYIFLWTFRQFNRQFTLTSWFLITVQVYKKIVIISIHNRCTNITKNDKTNDKWKLNPLSFQNDKFYKMAALKYFEKNN